ncbi:MAG TPA: LapA family protein [Anaerolineales bacterium]|nr:LapA family protein [Anaerolineales bacterium]
MQFFLFIALLIAAVAILFAAQNNDPAIVSFLFWEIQSSLAFILVASLLAGALISFFVSLPTNLKVRWMLRNQKKKITELENALNEQKTRVTALETEIAANKIIADEQIITSENLSNTPKSLP